MNLHMTLAGAASLVVAVLAYVGWVWSTIREAVRERRRFEREGK